MLDEVVSDIETAQDEQDIDGALHPDERKYVVLPRLGRLRRLVLRLRLGNQLYSQIQWTPRGNVFMARKSHELAQ